jgi:hypothetical protein
MRQRGTKARYLESQWMAFNEIKIVLHFATSLLGQLRNHTTCVRSEMDNSDLITKQLVYTAVNN